MLLELLSLAMLGVAPAQTHPCDVALVNNPQLTSPVRSGFCHAGLDVEGNTVLVTAFKVKIDGLVVFEGLLSPIGTPNAQGKSYYETPPIVISKGNHVSTVSALSADGESVSSAPFAFAVVGALPAPPTANRVKK